MKEWLLETCDRKAPVPKRNWRASGNRKSASTVHLISGCSILAKREYLERQHKICRYLHWNIYRQSGMDGLAKEWFPASPFPVTTAGSCTVLYDQQIHADGTATANYLGHRRSTRNHATINKKRNLKKILRYLKENRDIWTQPQKIPGFIPKESG